MSYEWHYCAVAITWQIKAYSKAIEWMLYNIAFNLEFFVSRNRKGPSRPKNFFWICDNNCVDKFLPKNKAMTILML